MILSFKFLVLSWFDSFSHWVDDISSQDWFNISLVTTIFKQINKSLKYWIDRAFSSFALPLSNCSSFIMPTIELSIIRGEPEKPW